MQKKRSCRICGNHFFVPPKQASRAYCDSSACQIERRRRKNEREKKRYSTAKKGIKKLHQRQKLDLGRRCRRCGGNCYPNYFFCPECHHYVSRNEWRGKEDGADAA